MADAITNMLNNPDLTSDPTFLLLGGIASLAVVGATAWCLQGKKPPPPEKVQEAPPQDKGKAKVPPQKPVKQGKSKPEKKNIVVDHPLWISAYNTGVEVNGFAYSGDYACAVTSDDHQLIVFDPRQQEKVLIKLKDTGSIVTMSDSLLVVFVSYTDSFHVYKLNPGQGPIGVKPEFVIDFPKNAADKHKKDIICMELAKNSKFFATTADDTIVKVWSTAGSLLGQFNTNQMVNKMLTISPDSRFITVAAFTSDVKLWEVGYKKTGEFDAINKVMDLRGHNTGINCACFSSDSTRVYTGAKDGVWRTYRINVRYAMNEDPVKEKQVDTGSPITKMELSPDNKTLAVIDKNKVQFWDTASGTSKHTLDFSTIIENCGEVRWFKWAHDSKRFVTVFGQVVHFWNVPN